jgi:outer membrane receptor protein involved in Fe transport
VCLIAWPFKIYLGEEIMTKSLLHSCVSLAALGLAAVSAPAFAQNTPATAAAAEAETASDDEIVVTAVSKGQNKLETSISVSSIGAEAIANAAPRSVAELFRSLPGIRSESSGGEGNANISVRGLPVASGGSKFLQLQEDGLPVLEFGDIAFGNADIFLRSDFNVQRVESVRGGSSSTFASNAPGGVINLISKTGEKEGGAIQGKITANTGLMLITAESFRIRSVSTSAASIVKVKARAKPVMTATAAIRSRPMSPRNLTVASSA